jgi:anti-sigma B factor antagonist
LEGKMKMERAELNGGILKVTLEGSLDIAGAQNVDLPFSVIAGSRDKVIVDLTASISWRRSGSARW